jgi:DNA repair protein RadC
MKEYKTNIERIGLVREKTDYKRAKISSSNDAQEYARNFFHDDLTMYESFFMIMLNNANNTTGYVKISQGGITGTVVDARIVAKYALETLAVGVILVHNHPSGNLQPSQADLQLTTKIKNGLGFLDIKVLDHIILTETSYFSFADDNLL